MRRCGTRSSSSSERTLRPASRSEGSAIVHKLRVPNPSAGRGKRGGYRLIYDWNPTTAILVLLILYTHDEKDDVLAAEIARARREGMP